MNDLELMLEIFEWRDVVGYEGLYKVSEYGDILSIKSNILLKQRLGSRGYYQVSLFKNGVSKHHQVHRIVAAAFCEGADYFPVVNHMDEDKTNNHYTNLEWCTVGYNNIFGTKIERQKKTVKEGRPVVTENINITTLRNFNNAANILLNSQGYYTEKQLRIQYCRKNHCIKKKDAIPLTELYLSRVVKETNCIKVRVNSKVKEKYSLPKKIKSNSFIYVEKK